MSMDNPCEHTDQIKMVADAGTVRECKTCLEIGSGWVNLRMCLTCGHVGCCDSSPNQHARKHYGSEGHPIVQTVEAGEDWVYCFADDTTMQPPASGSA